MKLIVINGSAESGKDKFIEFIEKYAKEHKLIIYNESTIDPPKRAAEILGCWDENNKTEEDRQFLVDLKQLWLKHTHGMGGIDYVRKLHNKAGDGFEVLGHQKYMFIHCREPDEIRKITEVFSDCLTLLIKSKRGKALKNGADDVVDNFDYDYTIVNNDGLEYLEMAALSYIEDKLI